MLRNDKRAIFASSSLEGLHQQAKTAAEPESDAHRTATLAVLIGAWAFTTREVWPGTSPVDMLHWAVGWRSCVVRGQDHRASEQAQGKAVLR